MSGAKQSARSARECIDRKEYEQALEHCKQGIKADAKNYSLYVFAGIATFHLKQYDSCEKVLPSPSPRYHNQYHNNWLANSMDGSGISPSNLAQ
jgi:hypothetical protein